MVIPSGQLGDPQIEILRPLGPQLLIAAVEYALAPRHACPAAADDVTDALDWLFSRAEALGGDPARVAVMGESAGGNLAAVAALHAARHRLPLRFAGVFYPMIENAVSSPSYGLFGQRQQLNKCAMEFFWRSYCPTTEACNHWRCTPLSGNALVAAAPAHAPTLVVTCNTDVLRDDGVRYWRALVAAGVSADHQEVDGSHGCTHSTNSSTRGRYLNKLRAALGLGLPEGEGLRKAAEPSGAGTA